MVTDLYKKCLVEQRANALMHNVLLNHFIYHIKHSIFSVVM